jgi:hypothetical protein
MQGTNVLATGSCQENVDRHISFIDFVNTIAPVAVPSLVAECDDIAIHVISLMTIQNVLTFLRVKLC